MDSYRATVAHNVSAMRAAPDGASEQVSQAIIGDLVVVLEAREGYVRVQTEDRYEGWILERQIRPCNGAEIPTSSSASDFDFRVSIPFAELLGDANLLITRLVFGSAVRLETHFASELEFLPVTVASGASGRIEKKALEPWNAPKTRRAADACQIARQFAGTPYLWGGTTTFGFDCSGLVQRGYSAVGIGLPRDAYQQAESPLGNRVPKGAPLAAGDLVFFRGAQDRRNRGITHVGMMLDTSIMIHAYGKAGVTLQPLQDSEITREYDYCHAWRHASVP